MRIHFVCLFWTCKILGHRHYWILVALYSLVVPWKIIRYIPLSNSFWGILASIIEMLQYGKYNSHSACHSGHYCCKNKNYSYLPCLQNKHSLRPCANVCMSTTQVPCRSLAAIFWWKSEPLLRPKLCDWSKQKFYLPRMEKTKHPEHRWLLTQHNLRACFVGGSFSSQPSL